MKAMIIKFGSVALTIEENLPLYQKKLGIRVLAPFRKNGVGLHIFSKLIHLHTNYSPLYGQGVPQWFRFGRI